MHIMEHYKISYESWVAMGREARTTFMERSPTEVIMTTLEDVHPELRLADLESREWRDLLQRGYRTGLSMGMSRVDRIEALRSEVSSRTAGAENTGINYGEYLHTTPPNEAALRVTRQDRMPQRIITHVGRIPDPAYDVYNVLRDIEGSILRLMVQPVDDRDPNEYRRCITHFLTDDDSLLFSDYPSAYTSVTFHCEVEGESREFTFKSMPSERGFEDALQMIYGHTEESDNYWNIAYNVRAIYVNVVTPYGGGALERIASTDEAKYYVECQMSTTYPNSCFYRCIRKIRNALGREHENKKQKYVNMRIALTKSGDDNIVGAEYMKKAEEVFRLKFIVLGSEGPKVCFRGYDTDGTFKNTRVKYSIVYDSVYESDIGQLTEYYENPASFNTARSCALLNRDNTLYGIIVLEDSHYHLVKRLIKPMFCERCGSKKHTMEMSDKNKRVRLDCLHDIAKVLNKEEMVRWSPEEHIVVYDFETVCHERLVPYSVSWAIDDKEVQHSLGMHAEVDFLEHVISIAGEKMLVAYYGSCFDGYFLLDAAAKRGIRIDSENTVVHCNRILMMRVGNIRTWDLAQFTKSSLNKACENFGISMAKLDYDFREVQGVYDKYGARFLEHLDAEKTMKYNNRDVVMTRELMKVVRATLLDLTGIDPITCLTLSQLVYKMLMRDLGKREIVVNKMPIEYDNIFSSIPAGRCEASTRGILHGDFVLVDKNSLYPHVCLKYKFPNGDHVDTVWSPNVAKEHPIYLTECDVDQSKLSRKYAGVKTKDRVDWNKNRATAWLWGEEIDYLEKRGDVMLVKGRTIAWKEAVCPFEALRVFLDRRLAEEAKPKPNKAVITMCKIGFNAATGKMVQKNMDEIWAYVSSASDVHRFVKKYGCRGVMETAVNGKYLFVGEKDGGKYIRKPRHWGCRVYGLSHLEMFRDLEGVTTMVYGDTDSAIIDRSDVEKLNLGKAIGEYKIEHEAQSIAIIGKKSYCMVGETVRSRLKGYKTGQKWEAVNRASGDVVLEGNGVVVDMFEALASEEHDVYTVQECLVKNSIRKTAKGYEMFTIRNEVMRKKLV